MTKAEKLLEAVDPLDATRDVYDPGKTGPSFLGTLAGKLAEELFTEFIEKLSDKIVKLKP